MKIIESYIQEWESSPVRQLWTDMWSGHILLGTYSAMPYSNHQTDDDGFWNFMLPSSSLALIQHNTINLFWWHLIGEGIVMPQEETLAMLVCLLNPLWAFWAVSRDRKLDINIDTVITKTTHSNGRWRISLWLKRDGKC